MHQSGEARRIARFQAREAADAEILRAVQVFDHRRVGFFTAGFLVF